MGGGPGEPGRRFCVLVGGIAGTLKREEEEMRGSSIRPCSGEGTEGSRWMPRCQEPKKGAARQRNARGSGRARGARDARMGKPGGA